MPETATEEISYNEAVKDLASLISQSEDCKLKLETYKSVSSNKLKTVVVELRVEDHRRGDGSQFFLSYDKDPISSETADKISALMVNHYYDTLVSLRDKIKKKAAEVAAAGLP